MTDQIMEEIDDASKDAAPANRKIRQIAWIVIAVTAAFLVGLGSGYLKWGQDETAASTREKERTQLNQQVNPKEGYALPVSYGDLGPRLIEAGVIDYDAFANVMASSSDSLTDSQVNALKNGGSEPIVITAQNAHFLLNFFWAVGLANKNPILTKGPMMQYSNGQIEGFASTGGWTLATKPVTEIYARMDLIPLTSEQQARVEQVAAAVYRPCCDNPTIFPDCNHGMAMLWLLELMASQNASVDEMFTAAKYVNAFWFPQQTLETAIFLQNNQKVDFANADAHLVVSKDYASASGANTVHQFLQENNLLDQVPQQGGGCSN